jgi:hypothetical protein
MNNQHKNLRERYNTIPGKIIILNDEKDFTLSADTESALTSDDEIMLRTMNEETAFTTSSRRRWLKVSTADPDRSGDEMVMDGCETENFLRNPQFLWMHGQTSEPVHTIGKILKLVKTATALYALAEYAEPEFSELAERIFQMDQAGYLPANSIGFHPLEWEPNDLGGYRFTKWELVEISKVELPANPFAIDDGAPAKSLSLTEAAELL